MQDIAVFYINLAHRRDRRAFMERQFAALGLQVERVEARTPADVTQAQIVANCLPHRPMGLSEREVACSLSHLAAWTAFAAGGHRLCLVLEDDVWLSSRLPHLLHRLAALPSLPGVVKLDRTHHAIRLGRPLAAPLPPFELRRLYSRINCASAYLLGRDAASRLLDPVDYLHIPVDHVLFDRYATLHRRRIDVAQIVPAAACSADQFPQGERLPGLEAGVVEGDLAAPRRTKDELQLALAHRDRWERRRRNLLDELRSGPSKIMQDLFWGVEKRVVPFEP